MRFTCARCGPIGRSKCDWCASILGASVVEVVCDDGDFARYNQHMIESAGPCPCNACGFVRSSLEKPATIH